MFRPVASLACALLVTGAVASQADAARLFFSTQPLVDPGLLSANRNSGVPTVENPSISVEAGQQASLYLWVEVNSGDGFTGLGLTIGTSNAGVVTAQSFNLPLSFTYYNEAEEGDVTFSRWEGSGFLGSPVGLNVDGALVKNSNTVIATGNVLNSAAYYASTGDPTRKNIPGSRAYYLGELKLNGANPGTTDLFMEVAFAKISGFGLTSPSDLYFGYGDSAVAGDGGTIGAKSTLADATITVTAIPEPASLGLLAIGGLMMVARRRRA